MPPKNRKKNAKPSAVVDGLSTEEMNKDQLEEHIIRLREELDREREERSYFQLERDKIQAFWEISKRKLKEAEAELRNKGREKEEAEERHRVEISVYKQKMRHVLSEQHNSVTEMKTDTVLSTSLVQKQNLESELVLCRDGHDLQMDFRQKDFQNVGSMKDLKLKHQVELMEMTNHYNCRLQELEANYYKKMQLVNEAEQKKRREEVKGLDKEMKTRIKALVAEQEKVLKTTKDLCASALNHLEVTRKKNKEKMQKVQKQELQVSNKLLAAQQENQRLTEELRDVQQKLPEMQRRLQDYQQNKDSMMTYRARLKVVEKELRDLTVEHELLLQASQKVQQERDELLRRQTESILDLQQRSGMKRMLLERKMAALTETLEKKEAQLCAALSVSSIDPTARSNAANKLKEILESKRVAMDTLQESLDGECKDNGELLNSCQQRLQVADVPPHDFRPVEQVLKAAPPRR
ncbi:dynein regulatory complex subunit 4-like [Melanotaenia boesemani]|uniref:dynein regulatory complex subunit 4-like n=1 Tax=Melanotaenia boesemani TaxID=1250792 RepID=UPI001C042E6A|nr:dynein regulatory complex subunit 4-like [Melanotaenia boesemani]